MRNANLVCEADDELMIGHELEGVRAALYYFMTGNGLIYWWEIRRKWESGKLGDVQFSQIYFTEKGARRSLENGCVELNRVLR